MLLPALSKARAKAKASVCLNNLKQLGLALLIYAQDWNGWFPTYYGFDDEAKWPTSTQLGYFSANTNMSLALLTGQLNPATPKFETPQYVTDYKLFVCPSSRLDDEPNTDYSPGALYRSGSLTVLQATAPSSCSYLYASGLNVQTHPETVIMADAPVQGSGIGYGWRLYKARDNHGLDGFNVLYVDGRAVWITTTGVPKSGTGIGQWMSIRRSQFPFSPCQGNNFYLGNTSPVLKDPKSTHLRFLSPVYW
ncbi:DUF1559 domain-containing protein [bacterium]|nr:DUF1559 domain-containing protein [bacterium]